MPIADKIGEKFTDEFQRLLAITPQYTFAERMMQLEAFSAATAEEQWAILRRYAVDQKEATDEDFVGASTNSTRWTPSLPKRIVTSLELQQISD